MSVRSLGVAILDQAWTDARKPPFIGRKYVDEEGIAHRKPVVDVECDQAITWLWKPTPDLAFWCEVAGINMFKVVDTARKEFKGKRNAIYDWRARQNAAA